MLRSVRLHTVEDWPLYRGIRLRALAADPAAFGSTLALEDSFGEDDWRRRLTSPTVVVLVDDVPVSVGATYEVEPGVAQVVAMWTDPAHRGRGYAVQVLGELVRLARERGDRVVLNVVQDNDRARRVYEAFGFVATGTVLERECFEATRMELS